MATPVTLVIIDDSPSSLELLSSALAQEGLNILTAPDANTGLDLVYDRRPQIVLTDLVMPGMDGMEVLERVIKFDPVTEVILMTAHYTTESAVEAIRRGASDYLNKPLPISTLRRRIGGAVQEARRRRKSIELADPLADCEFEGIVGNSPLMWELSSRIRRIAPHYRTALVTGPTGSGKNLVAQALHRLSPAARDRYVVLDCSGGLFEKELAGILEEADGGTVLLDEIGYTSMSGQAALLRILQTQAKKRDLRVIASTHRNLQEVIGEKQFREDLYYRLATVEISLPGLAEHAEDLPLLERTFVARFAEQYGKIVRGLTARAQVMLARHTWPGNVRELENVIAHACMMVTADTIDVKDLPEYLWDLPGEEEEEPAAPAPAPAGVLEDHERRLIAKALETTGGNKSKAARLLRVGRDALRYKIKKYNL